MWREKKVHQFHPPCVRHHSGPLQESTGRRSSKSLDPEPSRPTFISAHMWARGALEVIREPPPQDSIRMKEIHIHWCFHYRAWCLSFLISSLHLILILRGGWSPRFTVGETATQIMYLGSQGQYVEVWGFKLGLQ